MPPLLTDEELDRFLKGLELRAKESPSTEERKRKLDQIFSRMSASKVEKKEPRKLFKYFFSIFIAITLLSSLGASHYFLLKEFQKIQNQIGELQLQMADLAQKIPEDFAPPSMPEPPKEEIIQPIEPLPDVVR